MSETGTRERLVGVELMPGPEADAVVEAALEANPGLILERNAAVVIVSAPGRLEIEPAAVRAHLGHDEWTGPDLQIIMASYFGFISQFDDERIVLEWLSKGA